MTEQEIFILADQTLNGVVARITDDKWEMRMPASFRRTGAHHIAKVIGVDPTLPDQLVKGM